MMHKLKRGSLPEPRRFEERTADSIEREVCRYFSVHVGEGMVASAAGKEVIIREGDHYVRVGGLLFMEPAISTQVFGDGKPDNVIQTKLARTMLTQKPAFTYGRFTELGIATIQAHRNIFEGASVLDVGTGSGVLAFTAKKVGSGRVVGLDRNADWLEVTRESAKLNGLDVEFVRGEIGKATEGTLGRFDLIVANLANFGWVNSRKDELVNMHNQLALDFPSTKLMLVGSEREYLYEGITKPVMEGAGFNIIDTPRLSLPRGDIVYYLAERKQI